MEKQVLSVEQMQELIALGVDVYSASMYYNENKLCITDIDLSYFKNNPVKHIIPTFTLQDILKILPKKIDGGGWVLSERYSDIPGEEDGAYIWYGREKVGVTNGYTPLNAAFNMLKWCIKEDFIEKDKYVKNV